MNDISELKFVSRVAHLVSHLTSSMTLLMATAWEIHGNRIAFRTYKHI